MRWFLPILAVAVLVGAASAAPAPAPITSKTQAVLELQAAIEDEQRARELLRKVPPRRETAAARLLSALERLSGIKAFLSETPGAGAAETLVDHATLDDSFAHNHLWNGATQSSIQRIEAALKSKRAALPLVRAVSLRSAVSQCSDGKDNDGDGITDWRLEPGCTSARDVRESTQFTCAVQSGVASGRIVLSGSCSGAFSEVEFTLLDGLQLNGRFDIKHAPACAPTTTPTHIRCSAKDGAQNPGHLVEARMTTTKRRPGQRIRMRFFDQRKRQIRNFTVPVR